MPVRSRLRVRNGLSYELCPFCVPSSQPQSLRDSPFQGHTGHSHRPGRVPSLLRFSAKILLTRAARRLKPPCLLLHHGCITGGESFKPKFRHFHILSIKTALFVDKPQLLMVPSMKTAIFVDSKRFCTGSIVDLVRGTNCTLHGNYEKSQLVTICHRFT